jgi:uncharacterized membrane protein
LNAKRIYLIKIAPVVLLAGTAYWLLGSDFFAFLTWWEMLFLLGLVFMPVTSRMFRGFDDNGWMFSKVLAVAVCGYVQWLLACLKISPFTGITCVILTVICCLGSLLYGIKCKNRFPDSLPWEQAALVYREEILFFLVFLFWTYLAGFHPAAHGTEKYMDFGFMQAMMRSTTLPAQDMWYAGKPFNYYYGGQYLAVFLTKLTGTNVEVTYNLMRTMVAAFAFLLPFSLVRQMLKDKLKTGRKWSFCLGGILAGMAVSMSGNLHYIIYGIILRLLKIKTDYWFPSSTRYIGFDPAVTGDETIHEFPSYSFVLGDLHAHVINVFLVLMVLGILYSWIKTNSGKSWRQREIGLLGLLLGMFLFSNTWDFMIYYVVICGTLLFGNLKRYSSGSCISQALKWSVIQWIELLAAAFLASLPFHLTFENVMVQGIGIVKIHTAFYQFSVLWAFPLLVCVPFVIGILKSIGTFPEKKFWSFFYSIKYPDLYGLVLVLCAIGLIFIPEFVYVRDIYEKTAPRANTMFKLTYQAYIMFGIMMAYILVFFTVNRIKRCNGADSTVMCKGLLRCPRLQSLTGIIAILVLISTCGYLENAITHWFTGFPKRNAYQTLNATNYLATAISDDAAAIRWLNDNVEGQPIILEASGDSYQDYDNRVSAMTGLPTVLGWYVHEWLWRNDLEEENQRKEDVQTIYTSSNADQIKSLIEKYKISYLFIGSCEYEKYGEINSELLASIGKVVFRQSETTIIEVSNGTMTE